ncbi:MAG: hypothetical protein AAFU67_13250, partial [Bacteroidota bacterium]
KEDLWSSVVEPIFTDIDIKPDDKTRFLVNPTGKFVIISTGDKVSTSGSKKKQPLLFWTNFYL